MNFTCISLFREEPTFMAVIDSLSNGWVQQSYGRLGECLLPEPVFYRLPLMPWTDQVLIDPKFLGRSVQDDRRVGPIPFLRGMWPWPLASILDLMQHMAFCLGEGARLPLPQTMRRGNRMAHEPQKSGNENGGDDD